MRRPRLPDVPPRATLVVVVLALLASVVMGAPWQNSPATIVEPPAPETGSERKAPLEPLDMASLERRKTKGTVPDLFKNQSLAPPPAKDIRTAAPASPPPLPALPFKYLGRMSDGERTVVFLESGQSLYSVGEGDTVEGTYRVEAIADASVTFRHMPLGKEQTLVVPATP